MHWQRSGELIMMVLLGGTGTLYGPIVGAAAFLLLEETLSRLTEHWKVILGPLLVLLVLFARGGIAGAIEPGGAQDDAGATAGRGASLRRQSHCRCASGSTARTVAADGGSRAGAWHGAGAAATLWLSAERGLAVAIERWRRR